MEFVPHVALLHFIFGVATGEAIHGHIEEHRAEIVWLGHIKNQFRILRFFLHASSLGRLGIHQENQRKACRHK